MDVKVALPGSGPILSGHSGGSATITATLSNFKSQLKVGDIVEFSNNGAAHRAKVTVVTDNFNFGITRLGSTTLQNGVLNSAVIRTRPEIKEANKKKLLTPLGYTAVKNTNNNNTVNPSGRFRIAKTSISVSSGNATATAGSGLKWVNGANNDDFQVVITGGSGSGNFANGKIVYQGSTGFSISGDTVDTEDIAITGLTGVSSIDVIGTVTSADRSGKARPHKE